MRFRPYPKIPSYRAAPPAPMGGPWVALEKLHGAQLVVASSGDEIRIGKRKAWLSADEPFFGWQLLHSELACALRNIASALGSAHTVVYGELVGGRYPHPDVAPLPGLSPVQTGIWYTPSLAWVPFDILVASGDDDEGELLAHRDVEALVTAAGMHAPPCLKRGPRAQLEHIPTRFATRVPPWWGLPPIADNFAEGIVLKPDTRIAAGARPVIKRKLPEFDDARFGEAVTWKPSYLGVEDFLRWVERLVQPARLASARSKVGKDPQAIIDEVGLDIAVDLEMTFPNAWARLAVEEQERVLDKARNLARTLLQG